jgi:hypothetical protein
MSKPEWIAPEGQTWLCQVCNRHGKDKTMLGDSSCFTWAILVFENSIMEEDGVLITAEAVNDPVAEIGS